MSTRLALAWMACGAFLLSPSAHAAPPKAASAKTVQGIVSQVTDGDTLWLKPAEGKPLEVRLRDIDAPEICQPWGDDSRKALSELTLNKVASLQVQAHDKYGRAVGTLMIEDTNVSRYMVENGHAWSTRSRWVWPRWYRAGSPTPSACAGRPCWVAWPSSATSSAASPVHWVVG